jgi:nucleoside 2-deoxyribosyltransferase
VIIIIDYQIYLAGGMAGLSFDEMNAWRLRIKHDIIIYCRNYNNKYNPNIINPCDFYNFNSVEYKTDREVMEFDLNKVRISDLIIVDFRLKPNSIGTAMELVLARELHIPILGLTDENTELHPWLKESCTRLCDSYEELFNHIKNFYLT